MLLRATMLMAIAFAALAPAALAQSAFVEVQRPSDSSIVFADVGTIQRNGAEIIVDVLSYGARQQDDPIPYSASLTTYRYSCDWHTWADQARVTYAADGSVAKREEFGPRAGDFFGPGGWHAEAAPVLCDPSAPRPDGALASAAEAIEAAGRLTKRPSPPKARNPDEPMMMVTAAPVKPFSLPNFPTLAPSRYGLVKHDEVSASAYFIDWGNLVRSGDVVHVMTVEATGGRQYLKMASVEIDCSARAITVLAYVGFGRQMRQDYQQDTRWPTRTAQTWPLGGLVMDAACEGEAPAATLPSREAVMVFLSTLARPQPRQ
jgi:hypothetical protein